MSKSVFSFIRSALGFSPFGFVRVNSIAYFWRVFFARRVFFSFSVFGLRFLVGWPFGIRLFSYPTRF